jgi:hypothetical protein
MCVIPLSSITARDDKLKAGKKDNSPFDIVKGGESVHPRVVIRKGKGKKFIKEVWSLPCFESINSLQ